ncbi:MAG: SPFH domain-containing protein, partial [Nitrospinales bacterium]
MKQNTLIIFGILAIVLVSSSMFTVHMTQNAIILELQKPKKIVTEPGLYFKIPFIQQVRYFSKQLLDNDSPPAEGLTQDKKNLLIDNFTLWKIVDPLKFLETVRDVRGAESRLDDILFSELRVEIGTHQIIDIVTETRETIMDKVSAEANKKAA